MCEAMDSSSPTPLDAEGAASGEKLASAGDILGVEDCVRPRSWTWNSAANLKQDKKTHDTSIKTVNRLRASSVSAYPEVKPKDEVVKQSGVETCDPPEPMEAGEAPHVKVSQEEKAPW